MRLRGGRVGSVCVWTVRLDCAVGRDGYKVLLPVAALLTPVTARLCPYSLPPTLLFLKPRPDFPSTLQL